MVILNATTQELIRDLKSAKEYAQKVNTETVKTTKTASNLAFLYEKARNAIEFRDDHLVRIAAIERILKRRLFLNQSTEKIAKLLIKELSWAKYINNNLITSSKSELLPGIIEKYRNILTSVGNIYSGKLISLCACEIEEHLSFSPINQIITNYVSETLFKRLDFNENDKKIKSIQIYIAVEKIFAKNSDEIIRFKLLKVLLPKWTDTNKLIATLDEIEKYLNHPLRDIIRRKVLDNVPPFNLIRDLIKNDMSLEPDNLEEEAIKLLEEKYSETKDKVIRASKRSIVYIFLTKMVLAILIEIPIEIIFSQINYTVLLINVLFPPSLMILFNTGIKLPNNENTQNMIAKIKDYFYTDEKTVIPEYLELKDKESKTDRVFFYIFLTTSIILVIGLLWFLTILGFSIISQIIFLFFLSVVSFFAFRVREISNDYKLKDNYNESFWETLLDYIFLPIVKLGQFLSNQISKLNILSFIFDFIIEAPLKTFLEILEDWLHFVRVKKEEILS